RAPAARARARTASGRAGGELLRGRVGVSAGLEAGEGVVRVLLGAGGPAGTVLVALAGRHGAAAAHFRARRAGAVARRRRAGAAARAGRGGAGRGGAGRGGAGRAGG